jgi:hypothetical protein
MVVYRLSDGKRVLESPVEPATPASHFDFGLDPGGKLVAVLSDGVLEIVPVKVGAIEERRPRQERSKERQNRKGGA